MSIYIIGDVQGCYQSLQELLSLIKFNPEKDYLWFTGDLINRGPDSLETLKFIKSIENRVISVLGNHDLHFLAVACGAVDITSDDTFQDILNDPDCERYVEWMRHLPMLYYSEENKTLLVHAGISPDWTLASTLAYANAVEKILQGPDYKAFLSKMYDSYNGQRISAWEEARLSINYFTRMRYLDKTGKLILDYKGKVEKAPEGLIPWFKMPLSLPQTVKIFFGHWAALQGKTEIPGIFALDTGCCWGNCLTALRLEDLTYFFVNCSTGVAHDKSS